MTRTNPGGGGIVARKRETRENFWYHRCAVRAVLWARHAIIAERCPKNWKKTRRGVGFALQRAPTSRSWFKVMPQVPELRPIPRHSSNLLRSTAPRVVENAGNLPHILFFGVALWLVSHTDVTKFRQQISRATSSLFPAYFEKCCPPATPP